MKKPFLGYIKDELGTSFVLIACGLPGSFKTETTEEIARTTGYPMLRSDIIRLEVLKGEDVFDEKVASNMDKRTMVYEEMFRQADEALDESEGVILDATFVTQSLRKQAASIAAKHGLRLVILQTDCPQEASMARILRRTKENYESNALTEEAYLNNKKRFEQVDLDDLKNAYPSLGITHLVVDTTEEEPQGWYVTGISRG
ncbi:MAG TPA: ATP-binding protein [Dehalococcoidia bacterium]|nr:ATP-binding protein [Dehalococcoidia bacterium]